MRSSHVLPLRPHVQPPRFLFTLSTHIFITHYYIFTLPITSTYLPTYSNICHTRKNNHISIIPINLYLSIDFFIFILNNSHVLVVYNKFPFLSFYSPFIIKNIFFFIFNIVLPQTKQHDSTLPTHKPTKLSAMYIPNKLCHAVPPTLLTIIITHTHPYLIGSSFNYLYSTSSSHIKTSFLHFQLTHIYFLTLIK